MSLVGYDYSDDEDEQNASDNEAPTGATPSTKPVATNGKPEPSKSTAHEGPSVTASSSQLPPIQNTSTTTLSKDAVKRASNGRIQISAPSLQLLSQADSDEDSDDEEERERKRMKKSDQGSRLLSMLPKPKNPVSKNANTSSATPVVSSLTSLVPNSVANRAKTKLPPPTKASSLTKNNKIHEDNSVDKSSSFFFISNEDSDEEENDLEDDFKIPIANPLKNDISIFPSTSQSPDIDENAPMYGPAKPDVSSEILNDSLYSPVDQPHATLDPNHDVTYKKFIASKFGDESASDIKFVDFDMGQHLSQNTDWIKNITVEKEDEEDEAMEKNAPNSAARRKNQITYLAYQAKKRETELKNQWAQNRQTKNQTRAKYGF